MKVDDKSRIDAAAKQARAIEIALQLAVRDALIDHKLHGHPIVDCDDDGNVRWIPAEDIVIPDEPEPLED